MTSFKSLQLVVVNSIFLKQFETINKESTFFVQIGFNVRFQVFAAFSGFENFSRPNLFKCADLSLNSLR